MIRRAPALALATVLGALGGCQEVRVPGVYRIDIQQGNIITQDQLAALEKGMEKRKVRFILGTPLVTDTFNQDRWDYYYSLEKLGEEPVQRIVSVYFKDDRLVQVGGDVLAAKGPIQVAPRKDELVTVPEGYRDEGLLASLTPGFLSSRARRKPEADKPQDKAAGAGDAATAKTAPGPVQVTPEDERYLRDLMLGFGRDTPGEIGSAGETPAADTGTGDEQEGLLSRWARRLGLKKDEPESAAPQAPTPASAPGTSQ